MVFRNFLRLDRARFVLLVCQWSPWTWKTSLFSQEPLLLKKIFSEKQLRQFSKHCIDGACYSQVMSFVSVVVSSNLGSIFVVSKMG